MDNVVAHIHIRFLDHRAAGDGQAGLVEKGVLELQASSIGEDDILVQRHRINRAAARCRFVSHREVAAGLDVHFAVFDIPCHFRLQFLQLGHVHGIIIISAACHVGDAAAVLVDIGSAHVVCRISHGDHAVHFREGLVCQIRFCGHIILDQCQGIGTQRHGIVRSGPGRGADGHRLVHWSFAVQSIDHGVITQCHSGFADRPGPVADCHSFFTFRPGLLAQSAGIVPFGPCRHTDCHRVAVICFRCGTHRRILETVGFRRIADGDRVHSIFPVICHLIVFHHIMRVPGNTGFRLASRLNHCADIGVTAQSHTVHARLIRMRL